MTITAVAPTTRPVDPNDVLHAISIEAKVVCRFHNPFALWDGLGFHVGPTMDTVLVVRVQVDGRYTVARLIDRAVQDCAVNVGPGDLSGTVMRMGGCHG